MDAIMIDKEDKVGDDEPNEFDQEQEMHMVQPSV